MEAREGGEDEGKEEGGRLGKVVRMRVKRREGG